MPGKWSKLVEVLRPQERLEVLSRIARGELTVWVLPGKVKDTTVSWWHVARGSTEDRGPWESSRACGMTAPDGGHGLALFGGRRPNIPHDPQFLRVDALADGESFRDLEAGRAINAKSFTAPLLEPIAEDEKSYTELHGVTVRGAVTLRIDDLYVRDGDLGVSPNGLPAARRSADEWKDAAFARADALWRSDFNAWENAAGGPNTSTLSVQLRAGADGGEPITRAEDTIRNALDERRHRFTARPKQSGP